MPRWHFDKIQHSFKRFLYWQPSQHHSLLYSQGLLTPVWGSMWFYKCEFIWILLNISFPGLPWLVVRKLRLDQSKFYLKILLATLTKGCLLSPPHPLHSHWLSKEETHNQVAPNIMIPCENGHNTVESGVKKWKEITSFVTSQICQIKAWLKPFLPLDFSVM